MLVLSRKVGERILVGDEVTITVVRIAGGGVRIGIEAPKNLTVVREELARGSRQPKRDSQASDGSSGSKPLPAR